MPLGTWFLRGFCSDSLNIIENLALSPLLYAMMRTLEKKAFEAFNIPPERFTRFLLKPHDVLPSESDLVNWIEFLQEDLNEIIPRCDGTDC